MLSSLQVGHVYNSQGGRLLLRFTRIRARRRYYVVRLYDRIIYHALEESMAEEGAVIKRSDLRLEARRIRYRAVQYPRRYHTLVAFGRCVRRRCPSLTRVGIASRGGCSFALLSVVLPLGRSHIVRTSPR
jgi:hypothetical protein